MYEVWVDGEPLLEISKKDVAGLAAYLQCFVDHASRTVVLW